MRMLIIAGPYEADRLRREATAAGVESVAIEPSGNLASWIQATDPALIVLVPGILHPDPAVAAAKVRAASSAQVPLLLVGETAEASALGALGEGFLARPVTELGIRHQIRLITGAEVVEIPIEEVPSGPVVAAAIATETSNPSSRPRPLRPLVAEGSGPNEMSGGSAPVVVEAPPARARAPLALFDRMTDLIDEAFDEEIIKSARAVVATPDAERAAPPEDDDESRLYFAGQDASAHETMEAPDQRPAPRSHDTTASAGDEHGVRTPAGSGPASLPSLVAGGVLGEGIPPLDLASVIGRLHLARATGRLVLTSLPGAGDDVGAATVERWVVFERGQPVLAGSSRVDERMGALLVREERLPAEVIEACGDDAFEEGKRLGAVLVERGYLRNTELPQVVRRHYEELIYGMFAWEPVQYRFAADDSVSSEKILLSVHPAALLLEGLRRKVAPEATLARLGGKELVVRVRAEAGAAALFDEMGLSAEERRLTLFLDGVRSLASVQEATMAPWSTLASIARVLTVLDRLEPAATPASASRSPSEPRSHSERDPAEDRARVSAASALVEEADYFRLLGVGRAASRDEIEEAHRALRRELGPATLDPAVASSMSEEIATIAEVLDEGWRVLGDDDRRRRYQAALEQQAFPVDGRATLAAREGHS